ncbi:MAG: hypothetical protein OHK0012_03510 [Synechococcales cyanobacterium]
MNLTNWVRSGTALLLVGGALGLGWVTRPGQHTLGISSTSLQGRSSAQVHNMVLAAQTLDDRLLPPGETLSFNAVVGPRTRRRGYQLAPAFMTASTVASVGGGICQVSSGLYGAALQAGLEIVERHPHYAPVQSVPPGLDATVWYGLADLKVRNPHPWPVRVRAHIEGTTLRLRVVGNTQGDLATLHRQEEWRDPQHLIVTVYRNQRRLTQDEYVVIPERSQTSRFSDSVELN